MSPSPAKATRLDLGAAPGRLRLRLRAGGRSLLAAVGLTAAPALLVFLGWAIITTDAESGGGASQPPCGWR